MQKKGKQSVTFIQQRNGVIDTNTKLKMLDTNSKIKVNGIEITIAEYMLDPKKYNSTKMLQEYIGQIEKECEESKKTKALLKCNPVFADGYKEVD